MWIFRKFLNEIYMGLSKFDGQGTNFSPLRTMTGLVLPSSDSKSLEVQQISVTEGSNLIGGQIRRWKWLARELVATLKEGGPLSAKRGIQEGIEVEEDLVPTTRRCAIIKNFETVEVIDQPCREQ